MIEINVCLQSFKKTIDNLVLKINMHGDKITIWVSDKTRHRKDNTSMVITDIC